MQNEEKLLLDLLSDESFRRWIKDTNRPSDLHWQHWAEQSSDRKKIVDEARRILLTLNFEERALSEYRRKLLKIRIQQSIQGKMALTKEPLLSNRSSGRVLSSQKSRKVLATSLKLAAAISLIILIVHFFIADSLLFEKKIVHATTYGETVSIALPDGSSVVLNSNSTLNYWPNWEVNANREVWLQGEAFFSVEEIIEPRTSGGHSPNDQLVKFIVHTDNLDVEVVGTKFNVRSRRGKTDVTLNSGRVKLNSSQSKVVSDIIMQPGDHAELSAESGFGIEMVNPEIYSSWRKDVLIFEDMPLEEIGHIIEDNFGYQVEILDKSLRKKKVNTNLSHGDVEKFCQKLEETVSDLRIIHNENQIIMKVK